MGDEDKKHDPTPSKLDEERKKGNVLKVQDALTAALLFTSAYALTWTGSTVYEWMHRYLEENFKMIPVAQNLEYGRILFLLLRAAIVLVISTLPLMLIMTLVAIVVLYAQVGWLITLKPLAPKYEKIDPIKGAKNKLNIFKMKQAFMIVKTLVIMFIIGYLAYGVVLQYMGPILQSYTLGATGSMALLGDMIVTFAKKVAMAMLAIAGLSYLFERWQWWKGLKMSDKEIKDEYKKMEGDPHIKGKQKQKMMEMAMGRAGEVVPEADVIITNPTHYAIALEYKPKRGMKVPVVLAKGKNNQALLIRQIAEENFIPIIEDPPTAQALFKLAKVGEKIPAELFVAVAKIIAIIVKRKQRQTDVPAPTSLEEIYGSVPTLPPEELL
jgi:flagellar biosynthesis protein FlhB